MTEGIDVSKYQPTTPSLAGQSFLFARATYANSRDLSYPMHIANARAAGLVTGAYHFGVNGIYVSVAAQVAAFLSAATNADLYVLDKESDGARTPMSDADARAFIAGVKATGRRIGLYHSASGFPSLGQDWNWIAKWGTTPPAGSWAFWQYQGSPLDLDRFNGTVEQLRAFAGAAPPAPKWEWAPPPERLPDGAMFDCRGLVGLWDPNKPGAPIAKISGAIAARWRAGFHRLDGYNVPSGKFFVQVSAPGPYFNLWAVESDGEVILPVPPVVEQPAVATPFPPYIPPAPNETPIVNPATGFVTGGRKP